MTFSSSFPVYVAAEGGVVEAKARYAMDFKVRNLGLVRSLILLPREISGIGEQRYRGSREARASSDAPCGGT